MTHRGRRNLARAAGLALVACALLLMTTGGAAGADSAAATLKQTGWWWQAQAVPGATIPPPPTVKSGQLSVQSSPTGKAAFSAVRYEFANDRHVGTLTMKLGADGNQGASSAVLLACRTGSAWSPAEAGEWSAAPKVDTSACVNGQQATDGTGWTFAVGPLQTGTVLDIAIVPGVDPATKQPGTFSLTFDKPSNDSVSAVSGAAPSSGTSTPSFSSAGTASAAGSTAGSGSVASRPSTSTAHPSLPPTPTGLPGDKVGQTATAPAAQAASQPGLTSTLDATSASTSKPNKTAGYIVLVFAALVALYAYRQDNLMARNGGMLPGTADEEGGLGRFSKPRHGQPPALT